MKSVAMELKDVAADIFEWLRSPGLIKSPILGVSGLSAAWVFVKGFLSAAVLIFTFVVMAMHAWNYVVRQWCPVRTGRWIHCNNCPFNRSSLCWRGTKPETDENKL